MNAYTICWHQIHKGVAMKRTLSLLLSGVMLTGSVDAFAGITYQAKGQELTQVQAQSQINLCLLLIQQRLEIEHQIAKAKWNQNLLPTYPSNETQELQLLSSQGVKLGLDGEWVNQFFQNLFQATYRVQSVDIANWKQNNEPAFDPVLELNDDLNNYVFQLNLDLLYALANTYTDGFEVNLTQPLFTGHFGTSVILDGIWQLAVAPLAQGIQRIDSSTSKSAKGDKGGSKNNNSDSTSSGKGKGGKGKNK